MPARLFRLPGAIALSAALVLASAIAVPAGADVAPTADPSPTVSPASATTPDPATPLADGCSAATPCQFGDVTAAVVEFNGGAELVEDTTAEARFTSSVQPDEVRYEWLLDGVPIVGRTGAYLYVMPGYGGGTLAVRLTLVKEGYETLTAESLPVPVVDKPDPTILTESLALGTTSWSFRPGSVGDFGIEDLDVIGSVGQGRPLQAFRVWRGSTVAGQGPFVNADDQMNLRAHVSGLGWLPEVHGGDASVGTEGEGRTLEGFTFSISGIWSTSYDVYYRAHVSQLGWLGWAKNGEAAGTTGYGYPIEAVQITIVHEGSAAPAGTGMPASVDRFLQSQLSVRAHVQDIGWMAPVAGGHTAGTEGRSLRVEALRFGVVGDVPGGIEASAHVQNLGWQPFVGTGGLVGTEGRSLRVEAFRIRLTGQMAEKYDVYYRTHAQDFGWLGWAKNGEDSGTAGYAYRLEAVQVLLVPKGGPAPSGTGSAFHQR